MHSAPEMPFLNTATPNYDPELVKRDYECISGEIMEMQIALDRYNQTFLFESGHLNDFFRTGSF